MKVGPIKLRNLAIRVKLNPITSLHIDEKYEGQDEQN